MGLRDKPDVAVLNAGHPLTPGLVGAWPFDEGGGTRVRSLVADRAGIMPHGTLNGLSWERGPAGLCLNNGGGSNYVELPSSSVFGAATVSQFSVAIIAQLLTPSAYASIIAFGSNGDEILIGALTGTFNPLVVYGPELTSGVWSRGFPGECWDDLGPHVVVVTFDAPAGGVLHAYRDGVEAPDTHTSGSSGPSLAGTNRRLLGDGGSEEFQGNVYDIRIWDRALSPQEVALLEADPWGQYRVSTSRHFLIGSVPAAPAFELFGAVKPKPVVEQLETPRVQRLSAALIPPIPFELFGTYRPRPPVEALPDAPLVRRFPATFIEAPAAPFELFVRPRRVPDVTLDSPSVQRLPAALIPVPAAPDFELFGFYRPDPRALHVDLVTPATTRLPVVLIPPPVPAPPFELFYFRQPDPRQLHIDYPAPKTPVAPAHLFPPPPTWVDRGIAWLFEAVNHSGKDWYLEAYIQSVSGVVGVRIYDKTIGNLVAFSTLYVSAPGFVRVRTGILGLTDGHEYVAQTGSFSGTSGEVYGATLRWVR